MDKVIVTGASGFIGKYLIETLDKNNYDVYAVVRNKDNIMSLKCVNDINIVECNMSKITELKQLKKHGKFKYFFHLAWEGTSGEYRDNYNIQLKNIQYTCLAVEIAKYLECDKFIYAGSLMEYESIKMFSKIEFKPARNYIYRTAKLTAHYMAKSVAVSEGIAFNTGIISNTYGVGEVSPRLINSTIRKLLNHEDTQFTSGEYLYDFIYVTDVANAFIKIAEEGKDCRSYYIGNKKQRKLKDYLCELRDCIDKNIVLGFNKIAFDGCNLSYTEMDTSLLYKDTSFLCEVTFEEGIKKTIDWIREQS